MSNKKFSFLTKILMISVVACIGFLCVSSTMALAGQTWLDNGWIDPTGNVYYERYYFSINYFGPTLPNEPIEFNVGFPLDRAYVNTVRVLWENFSAEPNSYVEIPYVIRNYMNYTGTDSNYLAFADIVTVLPSLMNPNEIYVLYSTNPSEPAPNYSGHYYTVHNNTFSQFYNGSIWGNSIPLAYSIAGNQTANILVPSPGTDPNVNLTITNAAFNVTMFPRFLENQSRQIALQNHFPNIGPTSVKFYNSVVYGGLYLFITDPYRVYIYKYNPASTQFQSEVNITVSANMNTPAGISGLNWENIWYNTTDTQLIFGCQNGTVQIYNYDGGASATFNDTFNMNQYWANGFANPWGIGTTESEVNGLARNPQNNLVVIGKQTGLSSGAVQSFLFNNSNPNNLTLDSMSIAPNPGFLSGVNDSCIVYSHSNHMTGITSQVDFSPYAFYNGANYYNPNNIMVASEMSGAMTVSILQFSRSSDLYDAYVSSQLKSIDGSEGYGTLISDNSESDAGGIAILNDSGSSYTIMGAGVDSSGRLQFISANMAYNAVSNYSYFSYNAPTYIPNYGPAKLTPTSGNIDGLSPNNDSVLFVDNTGQYHFFTFDNIANQEVDREDGSLFGYSVDLFGTGQSIDCYPYTGSSPDGVVVGDSNGIVHFLNFYFPNNVNVWTQYGLGTNAYNNTGTWVGPTHYTNNNQQTSNLSSCFNAFNNDALCIVNNSGNIPQLFNNVTIKMQAGGPCNLLLSNFNMTYDTNNYTLTNTNRATGPIGVQNIQYVDLNQDGFYTAFELENRTVWDPNDVVFQNSPTVDYNPAIGQKTPFTNNIPPISDSYVVQINATSTYTITYNGTIPAWTGLGFSVYNIYHNMTNAIGDGIANGPAMLLYGVNPNNPDVAQDGLGTGWKILNNQVWGCDPRTDDTSGDPQTHDDFKINVMGCKCNTNDTNNNGISDWDEFAKYNMDASQNYTNGNPYSNLQLLGLPDPYAIHRTTGPLENHLKNYNDNGTYIESDVYYATTPALILTHYSGGATSQYYENLEWHVKVATGVNYYGYPNFGGLNPQSDIGKDGLTDYEAITGVKINGTTYYADPLVNDTAGSGIIDGVKLFGTANIADRIPGVYGVLYNVTYTNKYNQTISYSRRAVLDPDMPATDGDSITDGQAIYVYHTDPLNPYLTGDKYSSGQKINGVLLPNGQTVKLNPLAFSTNGNGIGDWNEVNGIYYINGTQFQMEYWNGIAMVTTWCNPAVTSSGNCPQSDWEKVVIYHTNPWSNDTDGDGIPDNVDPQPCLNYYTEYALYALSAVCGIGAVIAIPLNTYSANKVLARKYLYKEKIEKSAKRMAKEFKEMAPFSIRANVIPTSQAGELFDVKLTMEIKDQSFFGRACRVFYSAGAAEFVQTEAQKTSEEIYTFRLKGIPVDERVLYYVEFLDKGGTWVRDDNEGKYYTFATNKDGSIDTSNEDEWKVSRGIKCPVCGYLCLPEWDECPECNTPLHESADLALTTDEAKKIEDINKKTRDVEAIAWEEAQQTDEVWRGLPTCPNCGTSVQPDWSSCPVCNFDLKNVQLKKEAAFSWEEQDMDYVEGKEEEKIQTEYKDDTEHVKSERQLLDEEDKKEKKKKDGAWQDKSDEDIDIL